MNGLSPKEAQDVLSMPEILEISGLDMMQGILDGIYPAAPIERALMAGDKETGVCTIKMVKELDAGPILAKESFIINFDETNSSLSQKLGIIGANQLLKVINNLEFIS